MRRKAFTLIELLVVIGIIGILVTMLLPELARIMALADFTKCQGNLKTFGTAVFGYREGTGMMPVIKSQPTADDDVNGAPTDANDTDVFLGEANEADNDWDVLGDQAMQNVWLLINRGDTAEAVFRCPGDKRHSPRRDSLRFGWTTPFQYSYGMQWPYFTNVANVRNAAPFDLQSNVCLMADYNPDALGADIGVGDSGGLQVDPSNHPKLGTSVLWSNGSVERYREISDSLIGAGGTDDIYTAGPDGTEVAGDMPERIASPPTGFRSEEDTSIALSGRLY